MDKLTINIASDFSDAPGARYVDDGPDSGELFYKKLLKPKFRDAIKSGYKLEVNMDGTFGYATSFISESFGKLSKEFGSETVIKTIEIISEEDSTVKAFTINTIKHPE